VEALSNRAVGGNVGVVLGHGKPHISRCGSRSKHVLHTSRTSFPHPEFCYELSIVCALMACYILECSSVEAVGKFSSGPWWVAGEIV
jgi:hypothetical protein